MNYEPEFLRIWQSYFKLSLLLQSEAAWLLGSNPKLSVYGVCSVYSALGIWLTATQGKSTGDYPDMHTNTDIYLYTREIVSFR